MAEINVLSSRQVDNSALQLSLLLDITRLPNSGIPPKAGGRKGAALETLRANLMERVRFPSFYEQVDDENGNS